MNNIQSQADQHTKNSPQSKITEIPKMNINPNRHIHLKVHARNCGKTAYFRALGAELIDQSVESQSVK
jgi:hypothetical protein